MKVMIVGCNGQVGQELVLTSPKHWNILAVDQKQLDITCYEQVKQAVNSFLPDFIINAAAYTAVDKAEEEDVLAFAVNEKGPSYLAKESHRIGAKLLHISTDYVFSGDKDQPYIEEDETLPINIYGKSKLAGEKAIMEHCQDYIIVRTSWVFGSYGHNFVKTILKLAHQYPELNIVSDQIGGPTYARDIAKTLILMAKKIAEQPDQSYWGIYHYCGSPYIDWANFAIHIIKQAQLAGIIKNNTTINPITSSEYKTLACRPKNSRLNCAKIKQFFPVEESDWKEALKDISIYNQHDN